MNPEAFKVSFTVDDNIVVLTWKRLQDASDLLAMTQYPELEMRFNHRDISKDTVRAMLRDMEIPDPFSKAIMTRIAANAT